MTDKFLLILGIASFAILILAFGAVEGISALTAPAAPSGQASIPSHPSPPQTSGLAASSVSSPDQSDSSTVSPAPPVSDAVQDSDLKKLASAVHLKGPGNATVNAEQWARQVPVAEKLAQKMCDCEQRNWLNVFIATGNDAMTGSPEYNQSVRLLASLPLNDGELTSGAKSH